MNSRNCNNYTCNYMVCRFCGKIKQQRNLNSESFDEILCKINSLGFNIIPLLRDEGLPKTICFPCKYEAEDACQFFMQVQSVQKHLVKTYKVKSEEDEKARAEIKTETEQSDREDETTCIKEEPEDGTIGDTEEIDNEIKFESSDQANELALAQNCGADHSSTRDDDGITEQETSDYEHTRLIEDKATSKEFMNTNHEKEHNTQVNNHIGKLKRTKNFVTKIPVNTDASLWNEYDWTCAHCAQKCSSIDVLRAHSKAVHKKCYAFKCADCTKTHDDFTLFLDHVRGHRQYYKSICPYCDKTVDEHISSHFVKHFGRFQKACPACGEIFGSSIPLRKHMADYGADDIKKHICDICHKVFQSAYRLEKHTKVLHGEKICTCDKCGKTYCSWGEMNKHLIKHKTIKPFPCKICNLTFTTEHRLRNHLVTHTGDKPFICDHCGRRYRTKKVIRDHMKVHLFKKTIKCPICPKKFRCSQMLKRHSRQHTGDKPYRCELCARDFADWGNCNKHMKRIHGKCMAKKKVTSEGVFPINPETGQIIHQDAATEEWKRRILEPSKTPKNTQVV